MCFAVQLLGIRLCFFFEKTNFRYVRFLGFRYLNKCSLVAVRPHKCRATQIFGVWKIWFAALARCSLFMLASSFLFSVLFHPLSPATTPATAPATAPLIVLPTGSSLDRFFTFFCFLRFAVLFCGFPFAFFFKSPFLFLVLYLFCYFYESQPIG